MQCIYVLYVFSCFLLYLMIMHCNQVEASHGGSHRGKGGRKKGKTSASMTADEVRIPALSCSSEVMGFLPG